MTQYSLGFVAGTGNQDYGKGQRFMRGNYPCYLPVQAVATLTQDQFRFRPERGPSHGGPVEGRHITSLDQSGYQRRTSLSTIAITLER